LVFSQEIGVPIPPNVAEESL